jgi:bis(5'-nucleosyl)-tetraphosphatase (symmetrical)
MKNTYLIGDVQGCFDGLEQLLEKINYSKNDKLFFLGDVINRGDNSLQTLEFIKNNNHKMVLGNHDFHLLACYFGVKKINKKDTFDDILNAKNVKDLIDFLIHKPIVVFKKQSFLVHAGIPGIFKKKQVLYLAEEISKNLKHNPKKFIKRMYKPSKTNTFQMDDYDEMLRYAVNAFMRMRFVGKNYELEFSQKMAKSSNIKFKPWFKNNKLLKKYPIYFGHWSTLENPHKNNLYPLDTGYIWGGKLSAIRMSDNKFFSVKSS